MGVHKSKAPLRQHIFALGSDAISPERSNSNGENIVNNSNSSYLFSNSSNLQQQRMEEGQQPYNNLNRFVTKIFKLNTI